MEQLTDDQIDARLIELSQSLGYRKETIAWIWGACYRLEQQQHDNHPDSPRIELSAYDICRAVVAEANETPGGSVKEILILTGIDRSEDVGRIIDGLVEKELMTAGEQDSTLDFDDVFDSADIGSFLTQAGIKQKYIKLWPTYVMLMWGLYIVGVALVAGSYTGRVTPEVGWLGWALGMIGFAMQFVRRRPA